MIMTFPDLANYLAVLTTGTKVKLSISDATEDVIKELAKVPGCRCRVILEPFTAKAEEWRFLETHGGTVEISACRRRDPTPDELRAEAARLIALAGPAAVAG